MAEYIQGTGRPAAAEENPLIGSNPYDDEVTEDSPEPSIWTSPPTYLPGPDNHPFFAARLESTSAQFECQHLVPPGAELTDPPPFTPIDQPYHAGPPPVYPFGPPEVYPFIPAPTLSMLPMTPRSESGQKYTENTLTSSPTMSTPGLSTSSTSVDSSPRVVFSTFDRDQPSTPGQPFPYPAASSNLNPMSTSEESRTKPCSPISCQQSQPICYLTYMRALPNESTADPAVLLNGQVWRSGTQKQTSWRRNQWVVQVR